jgi:nitric oxide reductase activation protein
MQADPFGPQLRTEGLDSAEREVEDRARELLDAMRQAEATASLSEARKQARKERSSYEEMAAFLERLEAPAGPMRESGAEQRESERMTAAQGLALDTEPGPGRSFVYPEWDATIEDHKPNWVRLTEYRLEAGSADFVERVRRDFGPEISELRRAFEALRPEGMRRVRGLEDGDEIDLDRAIRARLERRAGSSPDPRIYTRHVREERDVAVAFLVDMSSSTNEVINTAVKRIIEVEKEALVLIAEAADAIGDSSAIWGFSGYGRDQVAFYIAKDFGDRWDDRVAERIGRMSWKMENRDGAAIRHATWKLGAQKARVRLLILLSDGRPLDCGCDHYADRYAQEDTRQALREARQKGIHPFCITVDPQGQRYLGRMYGDGAYTVIDRVEKLPRRIPEIYRKLTR